MWLKFRIFTILLNIDLEGGLVTWYYGIPLNIELVQVVYSPVFS